MCPKHWRMVPKHLQREVFAAFKNRSLAPGSNPLSWVQYYDACAAAVEWVASTEGKNIANGYRNGLASYRALLTKAPE